MQESVTTGIGGLALDINEISSRAFNIFSTFDADTSFKRGYYVDYRPISTVDSNGPFEFSIPRDEVNWTDMQKTRLEGRVKIVKADGTNAASSDTFSVCNMFYQSLFENILFEIEGVKLDDPSAKTYPYKSYIETLLSYSKSVKESTVDSLNIWKTDTPGKFDDLETGNSGFTERKTLFSESKNRYFSIPLYLDICHSHKYLPPRLSMKFSFRRNSDDFSLLYTGNALTYKIVIDNIKLRIYKITPSQKIYDFYTSRIASDNAKLNIDRSIIKSYVIPKGTTDLSRYKAFEGQKLPEQLIIGIIPQSAFNGNNAKNPFNFQHYNLREANLLVNGVPEPLYKYQLNIKDKDTASFYSEFLENVGVSTDNKEIGIDHDSYYNGNFLIAFDRSPDKSNRFRQFLTEGGLMDINLILSKPTTEVLIVLVYATYSDILTIDAQSKLATSYSI